MRLDWQRVVLNLRQQGLSAEAIARKVGMDADTLRHLARGETREPRFSKGCELLNLHERLCPDEHRLERLT